MHYKYSLLTYLLTYLLVLYHHSLMMLWWLMKGCMLRHFCNAVVWIAELVHVKKKLEVS